MKEAEEALPLQEVYPAKNAEKCGGYENVNWGEGAGNRVHD